MAIDPSAEFPAQIDTSDPTGYPRGKARNVTVSGDGTGTPFEERVVNDIFGLQQAILAGASAAPSGIPDKVGASQYLDGLQTIVNDPLLNLSTKISRVIHLPMSAFQVYGALASYGRLGVEVIGSVTADFGAIAQTADDEIWVSANLNRYLPHGATITKIRAAVDMKSTGTGTEMEMTVENYGVDFSTWVASTGVNIDTSVSLVSYVLVDATGRKIMDSGAISLAMNALGTGAYGRALVFRLKGDNNRVHDVEITLDDPSPRNF